jgi:hypothetical protein
MTLELKLRLFHHIFSFSTAAFLKIKSFPSLDLEPFIMGALPFSETSGMPNSTAQRYCGEDNCLTKRVYL